MKRLYEIILFFGIFTIFSVCSFEFKDSNNEILTLSYSGFNISYFNNDEFIHYFAIPELIDRDYQQIFFMNSSFAILLGNRMNNNQLQFVIDTIDMKDQSLINTFAYGSSIALKYIWTTAYMNVNKSNSYYYIMDNALVLQSLNTFTGQVTPDFPSTQLPAVNNPAGSSEYVIYLPEIDTIYVIASYDPEQSSGFIDYIDESPQATKLVCSKYNGCTYLFSFSYTNGKTLKPPITMTNNWVDTIGYPTYVCYQQSSGLLIFTGFDGTSSFLFSFNPNNGQTNIQVRFPTMEFPTSSAIDNNTGNIYVLGGSLASINQSTFIVYNQVENEIITTINNINGDPGKLILIQQ